MELRRLFYGGLGAAQLLLAWPAAGASLSREPFGVTTDEIPVTRYVMQAASGVSMTFMSYGATITDVTAPDRLGHPGHIVLGLPTLRDYETVAAANELFFGAILGRYANWIANGRFDLDGCTYQITLTDPPNTIHGGKRGFDKRVWGVQVQTSSGPSVSARLTYTSPNGEEGFPGTLRVAVTYTLSDDGTLAMDYQAVTDNDTVINLANHMNFNLAGAGSPGGVLDQVLTINADRYLPLDKLQIPLGPTAPVEGTPFDFRRATAIGARIHEPNKQLAIADGYDNYWVLNKQGGFAGPQPAVRVVDPSSGRTLDATTTEPGVQIYTASWFDGSISGIGGRYGKYAAFTIETQHYPDSPNHPDYPKTELRPGQIYRSTTVLHFGIQR